MTLRAFSRWTLGHQLALLAFVAVGCGCALAWALANAVERGAALTRAKAAVTAFEAVGTWSSQYGGLWVRSSSLEPGAPLGESLDRRMLVRSNPVDGEQPGTEGYHLKASALMHRELGDLLSRTSDIRYRLASDRALNPTNRPIGSFETEALDVFKRERKDELYQIRGDSLLFARRLTADASCTRCHDAPEKTLPGIRARFERVQAWGMKPGDTAGIISVVVPIRSDGPLLTGAELAIAAGAAALSVAALVWWLIASVLKPVAALEGYARRVVQAQRGEVVQGPTLDPQEVGSSNELHRISASTKAVVRALHISQSGVQF